MVARGGCKWLLWKGCFCSFLACARKHIEREGVSKLGYENPLISYVRSCTTKQPEYLLYPTQEVRDMCTNLCLE